MDRSCHCRSDAGMFRLDSDARMHASGILLSDRQRQCAGTMPDLLFLAQRLPYPPTKGEKIRAFHDLKYLAQWYDIHLGCLIDDPDDLQYIDTLRADVPRHPCRPDQPAHRPADLPARVADG